MQECRCGIKVYFSITIQGSVRCCIDPLVPITDTQAVHQHCQEIPFLMSGMWRGVTTTLNHPACLWPPVNDSCSEPELTVVPGIPVLCFLWPTLYVNPPEESYIFPLLGTCVRPSIWSRNFVLKNWLNRSVHFSSIKRGYLVLCFLSLRVCLLIWQET